MAPKKQTNKKKDGGKKELTEEDMRRLGMSESDIQRIITGRGKSSEQKKAEQVMNEARRREAELRNRAQKEVLKLVDDLVQEEGKLRVDILYGEGQAWDEMLPSLIADKNRYLRTFYEKELLRKMEEAKRRQETEMASYEANLRGLSDEERAALVSEQMEKEKQRLAQMIEEEEKARLKAERREARRLKRLEIDRQDYNDMRAVLDAISDDEDMASFKKGRQVNGKHGDIDELDNLLRKLTK